MFSWKKKRGEEYKEGVLLGEWAEWATQWVAMTPPATLTRNGSQLVGSHFVLAPTRSFPRAPIDQ